jgi:threonine synthase
MGYEIAEQLGWRAPAHVVVPCEGGSLLTKIAKAFQELARLGLIPPARTRMYAAQAAGCGPIVTMIQKDTDVLEPVRPQTIAKSLAIGNPADGYYAYRAAQDSGGSGEPPPTRRSSTGCGCSPAPRGSSRRPPAG